MAGDPAQKPAFAHWAIYFVKHSHYDNAVEVFNAYLESYKAFERYCGYNFVEGKWVATIVDHMTDLLVSYAEEADLDQKQSIASSVVN